MGEPGGLPSMGSHRVWHDWSDLAAAAAAVCTWASQVAQTVKSLEDPLGKEMATHPIFLPGKSMDRGVWQAIVHGVAKSQTWRSKHVHPKLCLKLFSVLVSLAISLTLTYPFPLSVLPQTFSYLIPKRCWRVSQQERDDTTELWHLKSLI